MLMSMSSFNSVGSVVQKQTSFRIRAHKHARNDYMVAQYTHTARTFKNYKQNAPKTPIHTRLALTFSTEIDAETSIRFSVSYIKFSERLDC